MSQSGNAVSQSSTVVSQLVTDGVSHGRMVYCCVMVEWCCVTMSRSNGVSLCHGRMVLCHSVMVEWCVTVSWSNGGIYPCHTWVTMSRSSGGVSRSRGAISPCHGLVTMSRSSGGVSRSRGAISPCHGLVTMSRSSGGVPLNEHLEAVVGCEVEFSQSRVGHWTGPLALIQPSTDVVSPCHGRVTVSRSGADVSLYQHLETVVWCEVKFSQSGVGHWAGPLALVQPGTDVVSLCHGRVVVCHGRVLMCRCINILRLWFGVRSSLARVALVIGLVLFPSSSQALMAALS